MNWRDWLLGPEETLEERAARELRERQEREQREEIRFLEKTLRSVLGLRRGEYVIEWRVPYPKRLLPIWDPKERAIATYKGWQFEAARGIKRPFERRVDYLIVTNSRGQMWCPIESLADFGKIVDSAT